VSGIALYVEGGGDSTASKAALRVGFDALFSELKAAAGALRWHWKTVLCGGRQAAYDRFIHAIDAEPDYIPFLLVDSEEQVTVTPIQHLRNRDRWRLPESRADHIHLMAHVMETWLIADRAAISDYYGQGFRINSLPVNANLENVSKRDINQALQNATRGTLKERYDKIRDGSALLERVDPAVVRAACAHCERAFSGRRCLRRDTVTN
jgi:hypothetical protein